MKSSEEVLSSILKTTQMGQLGIRSVLDSEMKPELRRAIESQLREYDTIETQAHDIARKRSWVLPELNPSIRFMTERMTRMRLSFGDVNSKIAAMMIRGNTMGVTKGMQTMRECNVSDTAVTSLANKLIATEQANINQMKKFL